MPPPIWLDNNILVGIDNGSMPFAEAEIRRLQADGHEVMIPKSVEHEFLDGQGFKPGDTVRRRGLLDRLSIKVDTLANRTPLQQLRAWRDQGMRHGLSIPDANVIAQVRAGAQARGIRNPIFMTRDAGGTLISMRQRGVMAIEFKAQAPRPRPRPSPPKLPPIPSPGFFAVRMSAAKSAIRAGVKSALSAPSIASLIPDLILAVADKAAAREAIRRIQVKFLKEGFAKGVAAGVMGWTEDEVDSNLKNRVTSFRIEGLGDPAGFLSRSQILQIAENHENYAVDVGYHFSSSKTLAWKHDVRVKGFSVLAEYGYHFGNDPEVLFEFEFVDKLAWVIGPTTNKMIEPAIQFK